MQNPFKAGEAVLTKVKRKQVEATVSQVWKNEVQVKTAQGDLLWRTMYTVWYAGGEPLVRPDQVAQPTAVPAKTTSAPLKKGQPKQVKRASRKQPRKRR